MLRLKAAITNQYASNRAGQSHEPTRVMVKGQWLVEEGQYLGGDLDQLIAQHRASAIALHEV